VEKHKIKSYIKQIRGVSYKPDDLCDVLDNSSVILLRANNIEDGIINFDSIQYVSKSKVSSEQYLKKGDILICASSGSKNLVGKAASFDFDIECTFGAFCKVIRPKDGYSQYLSVFFQSQSYRQKISEFAIGANINNIRNEHIDELYISMYPESERYFIVKKINTVQSIISWRKNMIKKLDELIKARFVEMFGDPIINEKNWDAAKLNVACNRIGDGLHGTPKYDEDGVYPFINGNNLKDGVIEVTSITKMVNKETYKKHFITMNSNTILLSINGTLGKLALYNGEEVMLGKSVCYCNLKPEINRKFVYGVMNIDSFKSFLESNARASTIKNVGLKAIRGFKLILPPKELQNKYVGFVEQVNKSKLITYYHHKSIYTKPQLCCKMVIVNDFLNTKRF